MTRNKDAAVTSNALNDKQSTHDIAVQATAAKTLTLLRACYPKTEMSNDEFKEVKRYSESL